MLLIGESGSHVYGSSGKSRHSIVQDLINVSGFANMHDLIQVAAHPRRWFEQLFTWEKTHRHYALPQLGWPSEAPRFGSDFIVIVADAHNGLPMHSFMYVGLGNVTAYGSTMQQ